MGDPLSDVVTSLTFWPRIRHRLQPSGVLVRAPAVACPGPRSAGDAACERLYD
jgi:hypothetical protein